ncbi:ATP-binding protein [Croceitalea sp. MTPC5]|nr:ATP-binding protein [Croceitalea sp. MTPC5]
MISFLCSLKVRFLKAGKIVITGAPGTGKTVVVKALEARGFHCFHEIIRSMTAKAKEDGISKELVSNPLVFVDDPKKFNQTLLDARINDVIQAEKSSETVHFFDRGIPDVLAYMDYFNQTYSNDFVRACEDYRYDILFIMPPWRDIYISDNERFETFEEAEAIHEHLIGTYTKFGYRPIEIPKTTIEDRVTFILDELKLA